MKEIEMAYKSAAEEAKEIRAAYKALGWSSRKVSVRSENFSMGSAIRVTVKHPEVCYETAEKIAKGVAESIRRCEITHEILNGGNRFVTVSYSTECEAALAAPYLEAVRSAVNGLSAAGERGVHRMIAGTPEYSVSLESPGYARLWGPRGREIEFYHATPAGIEHGAFLLAVRLRRAAVAEKEEAAEEARLAELGTLEELVSPA